MNITSITPSFIDNHYTYLLNYMQNNSALKIMKRLKRIIQLAIDEGYITTNPWKFKGQEDKVAHSPLTLAEIQRIKDKEITIPRLSKVRDLFIFQCYTGLSYADINKVKNYDTDKQILLIPRTKTNIISNVVLLKPAKEILDKYDGVLPTLSNQRYNAYLKELGDICQIHKKLHTHLARHTYATLLFNNGVPLSIISKSLGHSNSRITEQVYAQMNVETIQKEIQKIESLI